MSKDADGCGTDEAEIAALVEQAIAQGVADWLLKGVMATAGTPQELIADLKVLAEPKGKRICPKLPPLPPYTRELEVYEEEIFERLINGECESETTVG